MVESSKKVKPWRRDVRDATLEVMQDGFEPFDNDTPLRVKLTFRLRRPKSHYGTGRNADKLKPSAPSYPAKRPDLDKLVRSTLDGLGESALYDDDSRIVELAVSKRYTKWTEGCDVMVREVVE